MERSTNAYIVGMSDEARDHLVCSLANSGYRVSEPGDDLRVLFRGDNHGNSPDAVVIDIAAMTPSSAARLAGAQRGLPGNKVVLLGQRASEALGGADLPDGAWGLVSKSTSTRSLEDLVGFLTRTRRALH